MSRMFFKLRIVLVVTFHIFMTIVVSCLTVVNATFVLNSNDHYSKKRIVESSLSRGDISSNKKSKKTTISSTSLFGLAEWRNNNQEEYKDNDGRLESSSSSSSDRPPRQSQQNQSSHSLLLLPFATEEALMIGQTKHLVLKDGRFLELFQDALDDYGSIIGMAFMGQDNLLHDLILCEIQDNYQIQSGFRGRVTVSLELKAVGRAQIKQTLQMRPVLKVICQELVDDDDNDNDETTDRNNHLVDDIQTILQDLNRIKDGADRQRKYDDAYNLALQTNIENTPNTERTSSTDSSSSAKNGHNDDNKNIPEYDERMIESSNNSKHWMATSWAVFTNVSNKSFLYEAIATTSVTERLRLGLKALLEEKFQRSSSDSSTAAMMSSSQKRNVDGDAHNHESFMDEDDNSSFQ